MKWIVVYWAGMFVIPGFSQEKALEKTLKASNDLTYAANENLSEDNFIDAEATYRRAISKSGENTAAKYNMGNAYYKEDKLGEAFMRYKQAGEIARTKTEKHKAYHNLGNVFMKTKEYEKAVAAYKEALRNNPSDEETRYNLALAKELLKKQQQEQKNDQKDQNQDQQNNDENKDNQDQKDGDGDPEDKKDDEGENDEGNDKKEDENKDGKEDKKEENKKDQQGKGDRPEDRQQQQQPRSGQLSPQQVKNILDAMNNEEKKVQEKMNAKKVKGTPVKSEKDW